MKASSPYSDDDALFHYKYIYFSYVESSGSIYIGIVSLMHIAHTRTICEDGIFLFHEIFNCLVRSAGGSVYTNPL